jgi:hypothetical protein
MVKSRRNEKNALVDRWLARCRDHPVIAAVIFVSVVIVGSGLVAAGTTDVLDLWDRLFGKDEVSSNDSIAVTLPAGATFGQAVDLLTGDARAGARIDGKCDKRLLTATVAAGAMSGRSTAVLLEQLRYRLPANIQGIGYTVKVVLDGGGYEISCSG